jgi:hypothetical protein
MKLFASAAIAFALVCPAGTLVAQSADLPKATDLLAKSVAAMGGADAYKQITSIRAKGTFEMPSQNLSGTVEILQARPAYVRLNVMVQGIGAIESGSDGKIAWSVDPMSGPTLMSGKALTEAIAEAQFDSVLWGPDFVKSATTEAKTTFGSRPAYKLHVVTTHGTEETVYVDAENFYQLGIERVSETPMGPMPTTMSAGDYKKFGALTQPTTMVQSAMGFEQVIRITSYEYNNVPVTAFDPPPAVKALIK